MFRRRLRFPRAIGFDFDHTLGIDNKLERVALLQVGTRIADAGGARAESLDLETAAIDRLLLAQRAGEPSIEDAVAEFARRRGAPDPAALVAWFRTFCVENARDFVVPLPGARDLFDFLRGLAIPCAILTNGWSPLQEAKAASVGFEGPILASASIGASKPDREAFTRLCDALGVPAADTWYVGDNPVTDALGSMDAGLTAIWLDAENVPYPRLRKRPRRVIHNLGELQTLLNGLKGREAAA